MQIVFLTDTHLFDPGAAINPERRRSLEARRVWDNPDRFTRVVEAIRRHQPAHVVGGGDLIDWYSEENLAYFQSRVAEIGVPFHPALGNQDIRADRPSPRVHERARRRWAEAFGLPDTHYVIRVSGVAIVVLDTATGHLSDDQWRWLEQTVAGLDARHIWIVSHYPLPQDGFVSVIRQFLGDPDVERPGSYMLGRNSLQLKRLIREDGRIERVLAGHINRPSRLLYGGADHDTVGNMACGRPFAVYDLPSR